MRDQLEALGDLARIDLGGRRLEVEIEDIRARLTQLDGELARMRDLLVRERAGITETESMIRTTGEEADDAAERMNRSTVRHNNSKNTRERDATQRELEELRRMRDERTARKGELETAVVQMRESATRHDKDMEQLQAALDSERRDAEVRLGEIEAQRSGHRTEREKAATKVRADLLRRYNAIRERRGTAVVEVVGGICRGCNIALPPQFYAKVHAQREVLQCPNCNRILVHRDKGEAS